MLHKSECREWWSTPCERMNWWMNDINVPTFLPSFLPTYLPSFLPLFQPFFLSSYLPTYLPTFLPTNQSSFSVTHRWRRAAPGMSTEDPYLSVSPVLSLHWWRWAVQVGGAGEDRSLLKEQGDTNKECYLLWPSCQLTDMDWYNWLQLVKLGGCFCFFTVLVFLFTGFYID